MINQLKRSREEDPFARPEAGPSRRPPSPRPQSTQTPPELPSSAQFQFPSGLLLPQASPTYQDPIRSATLPYYDTPYGHPETSALSVSTSSQPDDQAALSGLLNLRNHITNHPAPSHHHSNVPAYHYVVPELPTSLNHHRPSHSSSQVLQLEQVISWANAAFFLRLYLKYQHALMPLVHKPSFAKDIVDRRDKTDEVFRGLLFSLSESCS